MIRGYFWDLCRKPNRKIQMRSYALLLVYNILPKVSLLPQLISLINPLHLVARHGILSNYGVCGFLTSMSNSSWHTPSTSICLALLCSVLQGVASYPHMQNLNWRDQFTDSLWTKGDKNSLRGSCRFLQHSGAGGFESELSSEVLNYFTGINYAHFIHTVLP